jgi:signal peptide peptidase SppA
VRRYRFERRGQLALAAAAWGLEFEIAPAPAIVQQGPVAVVSVRGPMTHHSDWFCDSYDAIRERAAAAFASAAEVVVLDIDSPGGDCSGCFETARALRAMADASGKPFLAYANGMACSAGYALACAADKLFLAEESIVGSVGVISVAVDLTEMDRQMGVGFKAFTSGKRKADGNPHVPMTEEAGAAIQATVDGLAEIFFAWVAERRGLSVDQVRALEAGVLHGSAAVSAGLADEVVSFAEVVRRAAAGEAGGAAAKEQRVTMEEIRKALAALAEGDDKEAAAEAKRALAALDAEEGDEDEDKKDASAEDDEEPKSEDGDDEEKDDEEEPKGKASTMLKLAAKLHAEQAKNGARDERAELLKSRPDFSPEVLKVLRQSPISAVRDAVKNWPRRKIANPAAAAAPAVKPTRGEGQQGDGSARGARLPADEKRELDERMGLAPKGESVKREGTKIVFNPMTPDDARERLAARKAVTK